MRSRNINARSQKFNTYKWVTIYTPGKHITLKQLVKDVVMSGTRVHLNKILNWIEITLVGGEHYQAEVNPLCFSLFWREATFCWFFIWFHNNNTNISLFYIVGAALKQDKVLFIICYKYYTWQWPSNTRRQRLMRRDIGLVCLSLFSPWMEILINSLWFIWHVDGSGQERYNSSAIAMELRLSCTNPSMWWNGDSDLTEAWTKWREFGRLHFHVIFLNKNYCINGLVQ